MSQRWIERERAIMNGILSLVGNCNALEKMREQGEQALYEGIACKVRPTLQVCAGEAKQMEDDLRAVRHDNTNLRTAVESVIANQHAIPAENDIVMTALRAAAPGHAFL